MNKDVKPLKISIAKVIAMAEKQKVRVLNEPDVCEYV